MQHPFDALSGEYSRLLSAMQIRPEREKELMRRADVMLTLAQRHDDEWAKVEAATGVPRLWGIASFERESGSDYTRSPAQGDRWDRVSVNVPRGLGPYSTWGASCLAAYRIDHLDRVGAALWTWLRALYEGELFNGFGYRQFGVHSPYLWAWTTIYGTGKYTSDGQFDRNHADAQCGIVPMMIALDKLDPGLKFVDALPTAIDAPSIAPPDPAPHGVGGGEMNAAELQATLNRLGTDPKLMVDGSYGRATRRAIAEFQAAHHLIVDGLAGPQTIAVLKGLA